MNGKVTSVPCFSYVNMNPYIGEATNKQYAYTNNVTLENAYQNLELYMRARGLNPKIQLIQGELEPRKVDSKSQYGLKFQFE